MSDTPAKFAFGMIGLGTMGRNLLLNMADHGFAVAGACGPTLPDFSAYSCFLPSHLTPETPR